MRADTSILLDPHGDALVPKGYLLIDTEVAFLRHASGGGKLFIRGQRLCRWAERFFLGRAIQTREVFSPLRLLQKLCPRLLEEEARQVLQILRQHDIEPQQEWQVEHLLTALYGAERWHDPLTLEHSAWWLLWLEGHELTSAEQKLISQQAMLWHASAPEILKPLYTAQEQEQASDLIAQWLGMAPKRSLPNLPPFPLDLPSHWKERLRQWAKERFVAQDQQAFDHLRDASMAPTAKSVVAEVGATYYLRHPGQLSREKFVCLAPYLSATLRERLEAHIPPRSVSCVEPGWSVEQVLSWATQEYLPFRKWAERYGEDRHRAEADEYARQFIRWFVGFYPQALIDLKLQRYLVFRKVREIQRDDELVLLVVLDGLGWLDAQVLHQHLTSLPSTGHVTEPIPLFSALPTITAFAKTAILKGERPSLANNAEHCLPDIGHVLSEGNLPMEAIHRANVGDLLIWRINEPDKTYHERYNAQTIAKDVDSELRNIADKLITLAQSARVKMRIIVTSDHGRLLGRSERAHEVPEGMQAKGRAAWGAGAVTFGAEGYFWDERTHLLHLHAERFGLVSHTVVPTDGDMFRDAEGRTGKERFAHGGIYPEEVIVPWLTILKELALPQLKISLSGNGQANASGVLQLKVQNLEEGSSVAVEALVLRSAEAEWKRLPVAGNIDPLSEWGEEFVVEPWPAEAQWKHVTAEIRIRIRDVEMSVPVTDIAVHTRQLYHKTDLIEDLE